MHLLDRFKTPHVGDPTHPARQKQHLHQSRETVFLQLTNSCKIVNNKVNETLLGFSHTISANSKFKVVDEVRWHQRDSSHHCWHWSEVDYTVFRIAMPALWLNGPVESNASRNSCQRCFPRTMKKNDIYPTKFKFVSKFVKSAHLRVHLRILGKLE